MLKISIGANRFAKNWKNSRISWESLIERLRDCIRTAETVEEYAGMLKAEKDVLKDVGGFVGGELKNSSRKAENVMSRSMITLDADSANANFVEKVKYVLPHAFVIYSTHSHTPTKPRYRVIIPLSRDVTADEYQPIARKIAFLIGIENFDSTTFESHRLMYWPSASKDADYTFEVNEAERLNPDDVLSTYADWRDISTWPSNEREKNKKVSDLKKMQNPVEKGGSIGAFCEAYDIISAIDTFLSHVYTPCDNFDNRYTYLLGSTTAGVVLYDNLYSYSHHSTDPACGRLYNAWDLVRIHKFGSLDEDTTEEGVNLPSYKAMQNFATSDNRVKELIVKRQVASVRQDLSASLTDDSWYSLLQVNKQGEIISNLNNCVTVLCYDPALKCIQYNKHKSCIEMVSKAPWGCQGNWRDEDDSQLLVYLQKYGAQSKNNMLSALSKVSDDRKFHPILEYLETLPQWDCIERVDTLFIDYLGAEDTELTRTMTRKTMCAAIARVYRPGVKFDTMLVLKGEQGIGKGRLLRKISVNDAWFNDSMRLNDTKDKTAAELIQGYWIIEIGELAGLSKVDERVLKSFLSRQDDIYRQSYGRRSQSHPRQCIFIGTTNEHEFLTDFTGNRRYWIISCWHRKPEFDIDTMSRYEVNQIWAEALYHYNKGEVLYLQGMAVKSLNDVHERHFVEDPLVGLLAEFLERGVPLIGWDKMELTAKRDFWHNDTMSRTVTTVRETVCIAEIWNEMLKMDVNSISYPESRRISNAMTKIPGWEKMVGAKRFGSYGVQKGWVRV